VTASTSAIDYNEQEGTLPDFVRGFSLVARDEHRHVAFGARFLRDMVGHDPAFKTTIQNTVESSLQVADEVLSPPRLEDTNDYDFFGINVDETRAFAAQALTRRLKVIGLAPVSA
jgi:ribonucleoside-diphosphate reductase beta chain